jgi:hypothetical protein
MEFVVFALAGLIIALLAVVDRQGKRHHEENQAHRLEVAGLVQRIQDPAVAVATHAARELDYDVPEVDERELEYPGSS